MSDLSNLSDDDLKAAYTKSLAPPAGAQPTASGATQQPSTTPASPLDTALAAENVRGPVADIARSIYQQESGSGRNTKTSNAGAVGGMQVIPSTFKSVADPEWNINDPVHNARAGVRYISQMYDKAGGDPALTAAGYYGGPGGLEKARQGIAVADPRNPNAPTTLQYGQQVTSRLPPSGLSALSDEELMARYQAATAPAPQQQAPTNPASAAPAVPPRENLSWADVPGKAIGNLGSSAGNFIGGIYDAVRHPIDTANNLVDIAAGGLNKVLPAGVIKLAGDINPDYATKIQGAEKKADAIGAFYKDRYGSVDGFKNAVATDPVGILSDAATVVGGGAGLAAKGAGAAGLPRIADLAAKVGAVGDAVNPANIAGQAAKTVGGAADFLGSHALGMTTGVGAGTIRDAARAGAKGDSSFLDNLSGKVPMTDVLDAAKQNVQAMGAQKAAEYRNGMAQVSGDKTVLNFNNIDQAVQNADALSKYKGQVKNPEAAQAVSAIGDVVNEWKALNPADFHTPEGLDALKQRVGGILEGIPFEQKTARTAAGGIYNSIKQDIAAQAPVYAKTMKDYSESSELISQIEKTLSLKPTASVDTALRKLQSLSRNNANTNYGYRQQLANTLQEQGGQNLSPALAGQAMSSWTPRGVMAAAELGAHTAAGLATGGASLGASLAMLPATSPRLVGTALYGAGRIAGIGQAVASKVPLSAGAINLASQAGTLKQRADRPGFADGGMIGDDEAAAQAQYQGAVSAQQAQQQGAEAVASASATTRGNEKRGLESMGYSDDEVQGLGYANGGLIAPDPYAVSPGLDVPNEIPDVPRIAQGADFQSKVASSLVKNNGAFINAAGQPDNYNSYNLSSLGLAPNAINSSPVHDLMAGGLINSQMGSQGPVRELMQGGQINGQMSQQGPVAGLMAESAFGNGRMARGFKDGGLIGDHRKASAIRALAFGTPTAVNPRPGKGKAKVPRIADVA